MYDFIIIGGGISGIHAANKLKHQNILLLEKNNRLGGRIFSKKIGNNWIEFGAKWIHGKPPHFPVSIKYIYEPYIKTFIQKFNIVDLKFSEKEIISLFQKVRFYPLMKKDLCHNFQEQSLTQREIKLLDIILSEDYGEHICSLSSTNNKYKNYGKNKRVTNGLKNILKINFPYLLNQKVIKIENNKIITKNKTYETKNIILAIPLNIVKNNFSYVLSSKKKEILSKMKMGKVKVLVMIFEKIFWNKNITYWFSQKYPNFIFVNGLNNVLYIHEYSSDILTKTNFMKYLKYFFPNYLKPKNVFFQDWNKEAGGSWTFHVSNICKEDIKRLQQPENNIYLVGEYMSENRFGTIDGAYNSSRYFLK